MGRYNVALGPHQADLIANRDIDRIGLTLGQRRRRLANLMPTLVQCHVLSGITNDTNLGWCLETRTVSLGYSKDRFF